MEMTKKKFRNNGAIGALLDEYEKALYELIKTISDLNQEQLTSVIDFETKDEDCKSIQTILSHVVRAGYNYVIAIRRWLGEELDYRDKELLNSSVDYNFALNKMFEYNEELFNDYPQIQLEEYNPNKKINVSWGQKYDVEQLFEHAIVHILRHRRQIEKFKEKQNKANY